MNYGGKICAYKFTNQTELTKSTNEKGNATFLVLKFKTIRGSCLKKYIGGNTEELDCPVSDFVGDILRIVVLLQIYRQICLISLPWLFKIYIIHITTYKSTYFVYEFGMCIYKLTMKQSQGQSDPSLRVIFIFAVSIPQ